MNSEVASRLIDLNRQFYQTFAVQFSVTRGRIQPGVQRILSELPLEAAVLDLGCGNGQLARELYRRGFVGAYLGLDFSPGLLSVASQGLPENFAFLQADLASAGWETPVQSRQFDFVLAFAVLHHLPGQTMRRRLLAGVGTRLPGGGRLIHSEWQFLNSPRLRARIQPWESAGLSAGQVDEGDFLLDWRAGGSGLRYAHHFTEAELDALAQEGGFRILETFYSDGEGGKLGLYQIWEKPSQKVSKSFTQK